MLSSFLGFILITLSLYVMGGWLVNQDALSAIIPNYIIMVFNTALCFFIAGIGLIIPATEPVLRNKAHNNIGIFLIVFAGLTLAQTLLDLPLGIDQFFVTMKMKIDAPYPGRMATQTSVSFILCGLLYAIVQRRHTRARHILINLIIILLTVNFVASVVAPLMGVQILHLWYQSVRVALPTAFCFLLLMIALWRNYYEAFRSCNVIEE